MNESALLDGARAVAFQYVEPDRELTLRPLGQGLINDTFLVDDGRGLWVLQRINPTVFRDPGAVISNLRLILDHASRSLFLKPEEGWRLTNLLKTRSGLDFVLGADQSCWRAMVFLERTRTLEVLRSSEEAIEVGRALGWFHALMGDIDPSRLRDPLPGFHDTKRYVKNWDLAVTARSTPLDESTRALSDLIEGYRDRIGVLEAAVRAGLISPAVTHGDPKLDNILFSEEGIRAVSLIDLDTVSSGLLHHDLGDCFRSSCNVGGEGEGGRSVHFDLKMFEAVLKGYLSNARHLLKLTDLDFIYEATWLLPFELGIRFLTDHLQGDLYFKAAYPGHNLKRAQRQFDLVQSIEGQKALLMKILHRQWLS